MNKKTKWAVFEDHNDYPIGIFDSAEEAENYCIDMGIKHPYIDYYTAELPNYTDY